MVHQLEVVVPGAPRGMARGRNQKTGRPYKLKSQEQYEEEIIMAWRRAGSPRLTDGPYSVDCEAIFKPPGGWWLKDGTLSAEARRRPYPAQVPDVDNLLKQIDTLVACRAIPDDKCVIGARVVKRWPRFPLEHPALIFRCKTLARA